MNNQTPQEIAKFNIEREARLNIDKAQRKVDAKERKAKAKVRMAKDKERIATDNTIGNMFPELAALK